MYYTNPGVAEDFRKGAWVEDQLRGKVEHHLENGSVVIEFWNSDGFYVGNRDGNDRPHGQGTMTYHDRNEDGKAIYSGSWSHGKKHGIGDLTWTNGDR